MPGRPPVHPCCTPNTLRSSTKKFSIEDSVDHNSVQYHPIELILVSFNSARQVLSNELFFVYSNFTPQKFPMDLTISSPYLGENHVDFGVIRLSSFEWAVIQKISISLLIPKFTISTDIPLNRLNLLISLNIHRYPAWSLDVAYKSPDVNFNCSKSPDIPLNPF